MTVRFWSYIVAKYIKFIYLVGKRVNVTFISYVAHIQSKVEFLPNSLWQSGATCSVAVYSVCVWSESGEFGAMQSTPIHLTENRLLRKSLSSVKEHNGISFCVKCTLRICLSFIIKVNYPVHKLLL